MLSSFGGGGTECRRWINIKVIFYPPYPYWHSSLPTAGRKREIKTHSTPSGKPATPQEGNFSTDSGKLAIERPVPKCILVQVGKEKRPAQGEVVS
jgi:hypothetical protein